MKIKITKSLRISPSGIETFFKCSLRYKLIYIDEILPDPGSDNLYSVLGLSVHKATELNDVFNISFEELKKSWRILFLSFLSDVKNLPEDIDYRPFLSRGYDLLKAVKKLKKRWKDSEIIGIEKYYRVKYNNLFVENTFLSGRIDLVIRNIEQIYTAIDWKTSKSENKKIDTDLQMSFYIFYVHTFYGIDYKDIFGALVYPSLDKILFTQRNEDDLKEYMFNKIDLMLERISDNDFKREPKIDNCLDNCAFCPYVISCEKL